MISMILSGSNMVGYYKCSGEQKSKLSGYIYTKGAEQIQSYMMAGMGSSKV